MEYLEYFRVKRPGDPEPTPSRLPQAHDSVKAVARECLAEEPKPRHLSVTASPAPKYPSTQRQSQRPNVHREGGVSDQRILGAVTRSGMSQSHQRNISMRAATAPQRALQRRSRSRQHPDQKLSPGLMVGGSVTVATSPTMFQASQSAGARHSTVGAALPAQAPTTSLGLALGIAERCGVMTTDETRFSSSKPRQKIRRRQRQRQQHSSHHHQASKPAFILPSFASVVDVSVAEMTWFRIVSWALANDLLSLNDTVREVVSEARTLKKKHLDNACGRNSTLARRDVVSIEPDNNEQSEGNARYSSAAPAQQILQNSNPALLLTQWWEMLAWRDVEASQLNIPDGNSFLEEVDRCWVVLRDVASRAEAAERATSALLPTLRAAAALPKTPTRVRGGISNSRAHQGASPRQQQASAMSPSDIAGLARDFSRQHEQPLGSRSPRATVPQGGLRADASPLRAQGATYDSLGFRTPRSIQKTTHAQFLQQEQPHDLQEGDSPNRFSDHAFVQRRLEYTKHDDTNVEDDEVCGGFTSSETSSSSEASDAVGIAEIREVVFHNTSELEQRAEACRNIAECCATFMQQWEQSLQAPADDAPIYYATMLQALNDIQKTIATESAADEQQRQQQQQQQASQP